MRRLNQSTVNFETMTPETKQNARERIGQRIAEIRREQNISQQELADRTGIHRCHISRIEVGRYSVGFDTLQNIAQALGKEIDFVDIA